MGVRGLGCQLRSFPSSGTRGVSGPVPKREAGPGLLARGGKGLTHGARLLRPLGAVTDNYAEACLAAVRVGIPATGYRQTLKYYMGMFGFHIKLSSIIWMPNKRVKYGLLHI